MSIQTEMLSYLGSRLDWIYAPEDADDLIAMIAPLYRQQSTPAGVSRAPHAEPPSETASGARQ